MVIELLEGGEVGVGYRNSHPLYKIQQRKFKETSRSYSVRMWYFTDLAGKFLCHSPTGHSAIPYNNLLRNMQRGPYRHVTCHLSDIAAGRADRGASRAQRCVTLAISYQSDEQMVTLGEHVDPAARYHRRYPSIAEYVLEQIKHWLLTATSLTENLTDFYEDGNDSSDYESSENSSDNVFINSSDSEEEVFFEPEVDPKSEDNNNIKCE
ncbi:hypothetical protein EVAR_40521_1 [Eumeta japonica]|uniref:Uncharacterized protein n=1 Tax=Eumeta variegata TaxID=151549 RepID=A0A4C1SPZ4_EUMVA|nr:hypothetical protein EVAR_40521_1 [Eumeta japonica]